MRGQVQCPGARSQSQWGRQLSRVAVERRCQQGQQLWRDSPYLPTLFLAFIPLELLGRGHWEEESAQAALPEWQPRSLGTRCNLSFESRLF